MRELRDLASIGKTMLRDFARRDPGLLDHQLEQATGQRNWCSSRERKAGR